MITIQVLTQYIGDGLTAETANRPLIADVYPLASWTDVTVLDAAEITPAPNLYVIEAVCDSATLAAIEADSRFAVIWSETA